MAAETEQFINATFALWAGDFGFVEESLREFSPPHNTPSIDEGAESPEDFIRATGALRLRQLWQKRGEFKKLAAEYADHDVEITDKPIILETKHLRATLKAFRSRNGPFQNPAPPPRYETRCCRSCCRASCACPPPPNSRSPAYEHRHRSAAFTPLHRPN